MYLKSLTLRGFKSFASATTLRFEPGITAVVGPNGSGKSNVVDALAWVMGEQGAKTLRGGRMDDVIFAGAGRSSGGPGRAALGRAEVVLTIDNSDGALPIDYSEVSITRTMFRQGGSDYAINGQSCRLLDIQELLSDSGIGREMHVIVGQGRLDAVLAAGPEERRAFVEEAAGVLKHRRRKEKALRKLDAMAANLARVADLTAELRRQLKPLGRQAETARRAQQIAAELREVRGRLLAADHAQVAAALSTATAAHGALETRRALLGRRTASERADRDRVEALAARAGLLTTATQQEWFAMSGLLDRLSGTLALARERAGGGGGESSGQPDEAGAEPAQLRAEAVEARRVEADRRADLAQAEGVAAAAAAAREAAQHQLARVEHRVAEVTRTQGRLRDRVATLAGELAAARSRRAARLAEIERTRAAVAEAAGRAEAAERAFTAREHGVAGLDAGEGDLDADHDRAAAAHAAATAALEELREATRTVGAERSAVGARRDALRLGLDARDAAAALLDRDLAAATVAESITVEAGWEPAVAAALGRWADAVVVDGPQGALAALAALAEPDLGQAAVLVASASAEPAVAERAAGLPAGTPGVRLAALVGRRPGAPPITAALAALLGDLVGVRDLTEAAAVVAAGAAAGVELTAVTRDGDLLGPWAAAGGRAGRSRVELATAVAESTASLERLAHDTQRLRFDLAAATEAERLAAAAVAATLERLHESDARLAAVADELGQLGQAARAARAEGQRLSLALDTATGAAAADSADIDTRQQRLDAARAEALALPGTLFDPTGEPPDAVPDRVAGAAALEAARAAEVDARLALRGAQERLAAVDGRAEALERQATAREAAVARARRVAADRSRVRARAAAVAAGARWLVELTSAQALRARDRAADARAAAEGSAAAVADIRTRLAATEAELAAVGEQALAAGLAAAGHRAELDAVSARAVEQLAVSAEQLTAEFGPDAPVPDGVDLPADRAGLQARRRVGERALAELGRVNPLALEEFDALRERLDFLTEQLRDLESSRADLLGVVSEVDERVRQVFAAAFADTAAEFEGVFARLFPGGAGRLVLTDPGDPLTSGIEIEARPAGKKVARLSLLSGGERSLVAVALLVSIFKARPSPFYVLDEVEAALDDTNLGRLLSIYTELRESSQLLVVTHQKRTMEIADALYGVSMRGDGVTTVISQRVHDREPVPA